MKSDLARPDKVAAFRHDRVEGAEWDRMVADFDGICQEQLHVFSRARWPGVVIDPLVFRRNQRPAGGCIVMYRRLPARLGGLAVAKWGPIMADASALDPGAEYEAMVEALIERYAVDMGLMLSVLPRAVPAERNSQFEHLRERGFRDGAGLPFPNRYFVRIEQDDAAQRASFAQKWRYHLNKSEQAGLIFERYPASALPVFQSLYDAMMDRKRFPDYSAVHTLPALMGTQISGIRPQLFLVSHDGAPVAGAIIFVAGNTAVYLYGATNDRALPLNAGFFMHHRIIGWLRENSRASWYDLGGTDGFEGLHRFKSGMVGKTGVVSQVPAPMYYANRAWPRMLGTAVYRARDLRTRVRQAIQRKRANG
ncbi:MAG TPA: GNAT family N-acetyltransferase [Devosiaceae bacterium]|nr:GNAT family N-acetyltransferase [Devosiaceae bacterium]